ncbi:glycoside hydrolase family 9 protein [Maricaulis sp. W15]|uniref:glycoside hydrolase family 9 protein n=1 Tax=Maricaulis sp. W15 TaxID=1772333 RepID=UPI000AA3BBAA|nr:glycoside hydrolase family 9 protein [Maricaulis sp. W15]
MRRVAKPRARRIVGLTGLALAVAATTPALADSCMPAEAAPQDAPALRLTQHGFETRGRKLAILRTAHAEPVDWQVVDAAGTVIAVGTSEVFGANPTSADALHRIDLSALDMAGEGFRIEACGTTSRAFTVSDRPFDQLSVDSLTYFYHNRLGTPIEAAHVQGEAWVRDAGFPHSTPTCFHGTDEAGNVWPGCDYRLDVTGGWADAGDYGKYVVNGSIAVWTLQNFVERLSSQPDPVAAMWADGRAPMPENGNGVSDILDEARWQLEFMLAMQVPDGARLSVPLGRQDGREPLQLSEIDAAGLVHHKVHERAWLPVPILPADAQEERFLLPPSTAASLNLAASAAQAARLWREIDPDFAARCLDAARRAYSAARAYPEIYAYNNFGGGGAYGDFRLDDEFAWAATELFVTTGETAYLTDVQGDAAAPAEAPVLQVRGATIAWPAVDLLPALTLLTAETVEDDALLAAARQQIIDTADRYLADRAMEGYAFPFSPDQYVWGSNGNLANRGIVLAMAHTLTGEADYRNAVIDAIDYLLGRNALDQSYVSGYGERAMRHPHHRFWGAGADPEYPPAPPGAVSGGPNATNMSDPVATEMRGQCAPQACWADNYRAYALNEVAINWNAPLFWIAAYLDTTHSND